MDRPTDGEMREQIRQWVSHYYQTGMEILDIDDEDWDMPIIKFNMRGRAAGQFRSRFDDERTPAVYDTELRFNLNIARINWDTYRKTVAHEVAHHLAHMKWGRIQSHGREWKHVMIQLGYSPDRCHDYKMPGDDLPRKIRITRTGRMRRVRGRGVGNIQLAVVKTFADNPNATEEDLWDAIRPHVKGDDNATHYTKQYYRMAVALVNGMGSHEL
jgi:hypothetical protein